MEMSDLQEFIRSEVAVQVARQITEVRRTVEDRTKALRDGRDGKDGASGRDGVGIKGASLREGRLVLTWTDGTEQDLGPVVGPKGEPGMDGAAGLNGKDGRDGIDGKDGAPGLSGKDGADGRHGIDGKDGRDGRDGVKGDPGRDGKDGLTGAEVQEVLVRTFQSIDASDPRNWKVAGVTIKMPAEIYQGVWQPDTTYEQGDTVTFGGSSWHCNEETKDRPGEVSKAWTLMVKRGRDGKELRLSDG
jgi:hypothetical protein